MLLFLLLGCVSGVDQGSSIHATNLPSVVYVQWEAPASSTTWVTWHDELGLEHSVDGEHVQGSNWRALVVAGGDAFFDYQVWIDGELTSTGTIETYDRLGLDPGDGERTRGTLSSPTATCALVDEAWTPVVLDAAGVPRWWMPLESELTCLRVIARREGVWYHRFSTDFGEEGRDPRGEIVLSSWAGETLRRIEAPHHHHDFFVHDDGTVDWIAYEEGVNDAGLTYAGDRIMRTGTDGQTSVIASVERNLDWIGDLADVDGAAVTWANHLSYVGENHWLSLRGLNAIAHINPNGNFVGIVGNEYEHPFPTWEPDEPFAEQHGGTPTRDGLLLHDNSGGDSVRIVEYALDNEAGTAEVIWELEPPEPWQSPALGDAIRLADHATRVSWGVFGTLEEVDADGQIIGTVSYEQPTFIGYLSEAALD